MGEKAEEEDGFSLFSLLSLFLLHSTLLPPFFLLFFLSSHFSGGAFLLQPWEGFPPIPSIAFSPMRLASPAFASACTAFWMKGIRRERWRENWSYYIHSAAGISRGVKRKVQGRFFFFFHYWFLGENLDLAGSVSVGR